MSTWYFLKKAARTLFIGTLFWNSVVPSFDGIVRRAATFHVIIFNVFTAFSGSSEGGAGLFRSGGDMGVLVDIACYEQGMYDGGEIDQQIIGDLKTNLRIHSKCYSFYSTTSDWTYKQLLHLLV